MIACINRIEIEDINSRELLFLLDDLARRSSFDDLIRVGFSYHKAFLSKKYLFKDIRLSDQSSSLKNGMVSLSYKALQPGGTDEFNHVALLVLWFRLCSWMVNKADESVFLDVQSNEQASMDGLFGFVYCPIRFCKERTAIYFDKALLRLPVSRVFSGGHIDTKQMIESLMSCHSPVGGFSIESKVCELYRHDVKNINVTAGDIAARLNMSESSLRRRLNERGRTFQQVRDCFRRDAAIEMLRVKKYTLIDIAYRLGFSDVSAFSRSFYRMTGLRPINYRVKLVQLLDHE